MPKVTGWTGTCPGDNKLVVVNGIVTDCKKR
jgi:hypothetical protein